MEIEPGEAPFEGRGDRAVLLAEGNERGLELGERAPLVGLENLALHDAEVDLDLVQPGRVDRRVDDPDLRSPFAQPGLGPGAGCELPLSTTQKTRRALAYGSSLMTWSTHFGYSYNAQTGVVVATVDGYDISQGVTTFKFQFVSRDGGLAGSLNFLQHGSPNGNYLELSPGSCTFA